MLAEHLKFPGCISAIRYRITGNRSIDLSGKGADLNEPFNFMSVYVFESSDAARAWNGSPGHKKVMAERNPTFEQGMIGITGAEDS